jgi:hypothetical protein
MIYENRGCFASKNASRVPNFAMASVEKWRMRQLPIYLGVVSGVRFLLVLPKAIWSDGFLEDYSKICRGVFAKV